MRWPSFVLAFSLFSGLWSGEVIRVLVNRWSTLNPLLINQDTDSEATDLVFDRLVTLDAEGRFIPEMLESWTILKGGREAILKLRPGLTWQDGRPIEAEDIVFTWKALRLPRVRAIGDTVSGTATLDSLTAEGALTVRIRLARPRGTLLMDVYNLVPVPRHRYQVGADPKAAPVNFHPVGSGPYRVVGAATSKVVQLERWAGYRGIHPGKAEGFELRDTTSEEAGGLKALESGQLHFAPLGGQLASLNYYLVRKEVRGAGQLQCQAIPQASLAAYFLNCDSRRSLLGDVVLRRALAELVPWQDLAKGQRFLPARRATGFWPPESWAYDPTPRPVPRPERAVAILEEAGWKPGPDGVRLDARGRRLVLVAYEGSEGGGANHGSMANLLAAQAARVGIRIEVRAIPFQEVTANSLKHEGDIWSFSWSEAMDPDVDSTLFTKEGYQTNANCSGYLNPEVDRLFDLGRHTLDQEARKAIYRELSEILYRDKPIIPITYSHLRVVMNKRLQGVAFNNLGQSFGFWPGRRDWRLGP